MARSGPRSGGCVGVGVGRTAGGVEAGAGDVREDNGVVLAG